MNSIKNKIFIQSDGNIGTSRTLIASLDLSTRYDGVILPTGTTSQRPTGSELVEGLLRFNTTTRNFEYFNSSQWTTIESDYTPIQSITPGTSALTNDEVIINGRDFNINMNFEFIGRSGTSYPVSNWKLDNSSLLKVRRPANMTYDDEPYSFRVNQNDGRKYQLDDVLEVSLNPIPLPTTNAVFLGSYYSNVQLSNVSIASGFDSNYLVSGIYSCNLPTGLTLTYSGSNFILNGILSEMPQTTNYGFNVGIVFSSGRSLIRNYSLVVISSSYLFNQFTSATRSTFIVGYSMRLMNPSYEGPIVQVRRDSDNATQDFYANTNGALGTQFEGTGTSLTSWLGTATGYVAIWYDQTGNGRNATQATTAYQPKIAIETMSGRYTVYFHSTSTTDIKFLSIGSLTLSTPFTFIFTSVKTRAGRWISQKPQPPNTIVGYWDNYEASFYMDNNPGDGSTPNTLSQFTTTYNKLHLHMTAKTATALSYYYLNGTLKYENVSGTATNFGTSIILGGGYSDSEYGAGYFHELLISNTAIASTELNAVQSDIATFYNFKNSVLGIGFAYPPSTITGLANTNPLTFTVTGQTYGNGSYTLSASGGFDLGTVFDNNNSTYYNVVGYVESTGIYTGSTTTVVSNISYIGEWYQMKLPQSIVLQKYTIGAVDRTYSANSWIMAGSTDGSNWVLLDDRPDGTGVATLVSFSNTEYSITNPQYRFIYYRMIARNTISRYLWAIGSFQLKGYT